MSLAGVYSGKADGTVKGCKCYYKNVQKVENKNVHSKDMC